MKRTLINIAILSTILGTGMAGGWDRSGQDTSIILKEGNLLEVTSVSVKPNITGTYNSTAAAAANNVTATGGVVPDYSFTTFGFRIEINDNMSLAIVQDTPFGAEVNWTAGLYAGTKAEIKTSATTALVSYDIDNVIIYGGLKNQSFSASAAVPLRSYTIASTTDSSLGYVVGAAVEKPEIAMRVALTYHSSVSHDVTISEIVGGVTKDATILSAKTPSSFNLDFQTGVAENTLLFGTIRRVNWTQTVLDPINYSARPLKKFTQDTTSYSLGLGRKFSDTWSGAVTYGTEAAEGVAGGPLGPTDGYNKMGVGVTYAGEQATITLGMQKINLGDASSEAGGGAYKAAMSGNTALVTAVKVGYKF